MKNKLSDNNMVYMRILLVFMFLVIATGGFGQQKLHGKVSDENGQPLSNASIFISGFKIGTTTDVAGEFTLNTPLAGSFKLVATYIGYETLMQSLNPVSIAQNINFIMKPVSNQLKGIIVTSHSNNNWKRWGTVFTDGFIGKSVFAGKCKIINQDVIGFDYDEEKNVLHAYASEPIIVRNEDLGYIISVSLTNFDLFISNNDVDYQVYLLFKEMEGDAKQHTLWEGNRLKAYSLSFMHFSRALYNRKLKEEGYEVRQFTVKVNKEKERVKKLYLQNPALYQDSLRYYKKILAEKDNNIKLSEPLTAKEILVKVDSNTLALKFQDELQIVYKKIKEPEEYYNFRNQLTLTTESTTVSNTGISTSQLIMPVKNYPFTELKLVKGVPVEITETGYINNTNLYMHGFWGWWEKIATKLPYDYEPN